MDAKTWAVIDKAFGKIAQKAIAGKKTRTRSATAVRKYAIEIRETARVLAETLGAIEALEKAADEEL